MSAFESYILPNSWSFGNFNAFALVLSPIQFFAVSITLAVRLVFLLSLLSELDTLFFCE